MGSGRLRRRLRRLIQPRLPGVRDLEVESGPLQWLREGMGETGKELLKAYAHKRGPVRVMFMCEQGTITGFSNQVTALFESYLKARGLDKFFALERGGFLRTPKEIAEGLRMTGKSDTLMDIFSYRERLPQERVDYIVPLYADRPPNIESALLMVDEPKPVMLNNPFPDDIRAPYQPRNYRKLLAELTEHLKEKLK